jgi:predicted kinase
MRSARGWGLEPRGERVVLVSGAPASGKTTLAAALAPRLQLPLLSKDHINETLVGALGGPTDDLSYSRRLGNAAMLLLWTLAERCPHVMLEANFRPHSDVERARILALHADLIEVYCQCPPDETRRRFAARARQQPHAAHPLESLPSELLAEYDGPVGLGPVIAVDTTRPVDIEALARHIEEGWSTRERLNLHGVSTRTLPGD